MMSSFSGHYNKQFVNLPKVKIKHIALIDDIENFVMFTSTTDNDGKGGNGEEN